MLIASCCFVIGCINYQLKYNFDKKEFENATKIGKLFFEVYNKFLTQSFDYDFNDVELQKCFKYCYNFIDFKFTFELPLLYQIHQEKMNGDSYEDFITYQTTNEFFIPYLKEKLPIKKHKITVKKKQTSKNIKTSNIAK